MKTLLRFVVKFASLIVSVLSCFDRVLFKGYLPFRDGPGLEDEEPVHHAKLRGREPDADRVVHDRHHPLDFPLELGTEGSDLGGAGLQDGVAELPDVLQSRLAAPESLLRQRLRSLVAGTLGFDGLALAKRRRVR